MKRLSLLFILMFAFGVIFLQGCKKDEETSPKYRSYDDAFFQKENIFRLVNDYRITGTRTGSDTQVDSLINKVYHYITVNNLESVKTKIETNLGYPLWQITEFIKDPEKTTTITPIYHTGWQSISSFIITDSRTNDVSLMSSRHTLKDEFLVVQQYFNNKLAGVNNGVSLRSTGQSGQGGGDQFGDDTYSWDCVDIVNVGTSVTGTIHNVDSNDNIINIGNTSYDFDPETGEFVSDDGIYVTFGAYNIDQEQDCQQILSTSNYSDNPFGTSNESSGSTGDPWWSTQTNTWTKCKEYYQKRMNKEVGSPVSDEAMREMIYNNCGGCLKAMQVSDAYLKLWKDNYNNPKIACHLCKESAADMLLGGSVLQAWDNITFVCDDVDKNKLLDEILEDCDISKSGGGKLTWQQFAEKAKGKPWKAKDGIFNKYSPEIGEMTKMFGISPTELTKLSDADMCSKLSISECLKPASAGSVGAINNSEKAALLDFYTNTDLVNPCSGEAIDKDAIFKAMCEKGEVSMSGLDEGVLPQVCNQECSAILLDISGQCEGLIDRYVPCSEVIFTRKGDRTFMQMEIDNYAFSACVPPPVDEEEDDAIMGGLLRSVNLKIEIDLPSYMVYTQFGYTNAQTRVAQFLSAAMQYASDVIPSLNSCDQLGTLRYQYRNAFMSYLRDPDNMEEYLGTSFGIFMKENFYEQNVSCTKTAPSLFSSVTKCN